MSSGKKTMIWQMADGQWPLATGHWPLEGRVLLEGRLVTSWFRVVAPPPQTLKFENLRPRVFFQIW